MIALSHPYSVGTPLLFFIFSSSSSFCFPILFIVHPYVGWLLRWLKIILGVAAQLTRLQALGSRPKISPPVLFRGSRRARCSTPDFISVHDIEFLTLFPPYFNCAIDNKCGRRLESFVLPSFPCTRTQLHKGSSNFRFINFHLHL